MAVITKPVVLDESFNNKMDNLVSAVLEVARGGKHHLYGFHIDSGVSSPSNAITYLEDAVGMTPAHMDYINGVFDYGTWANAFFMPKPCMLKADGTVDYYLNPNDYTKKADGTASDIANTAYNGNAMMEWDKIYIKIEPDAGDETSASIYFADYKADDDFHCWSNYNINNQEIPHFYTPIYNGSLIDGKLRSLSGQANTALCQSKTAAQEITAAELNNVGSAKIWYTEQFSDILIINLLLVLMGKSLDTQGVFGNGNDNSGGSADHMLGTGTMNDKGLFWGSNAHNLGVKVFGMENYWANQWRRYAGHIMVDRVQKYKLTRGTIDGSTATDYNTTASGYKSAPITTPTANGYVSKFGFTPDMMAQKEVAGGSTTYYCDYYYQATGTTYAYRGGHCDYGAGCGAFCVGLGGGAGVASWAVGAAVSCKPLG